MSVLTGTQVLLLVVSETGLVYTFTTPKLQPLVTKAEGKNLIQVRTQGSSSDVARGDRVASPMGANVSPTQACLNAPEPTPGNENGVDDSNTVDSPEEPTNAHLPPQQQRAMPGSHMPPAYMSNVGMDPQQALAYSSYMQGRGNAGYAVPQSGLPQHSSHQS